MESGLLDNGVHTFRVLAMDNAGAFSDTASRTFTVDLANQKPTVTILSGPSGVTTDNTPTFTWQSHDADGTVEGYYVSIDVNPPTAWITDTSYTSDPLPEDEHTFYIMARDNAGANSSVYSRDFEVVIPKGLLMWAKQSSGSGDDISIDLCVLSDDSIVIIGAFEEDVILGPGEISETQFFSAGHTDIFIAKYNPNGTLAWAKRAGGTADDYSFAVSALSDDSIVVTGNFGEKATFGPGEPAETELYCPGIYGIFVARFNPDGTLAWAKRVGGTGFKNNGCAVSAFSDDFIAVTGYYTEQATFGPGEPAETVLVSAGESDAFIARYNMDGTLAWAKHVYGTYDDYCWAASTASDGSIMATGSFEYIATFGPGEPNETVLTSSVQHSMFLARYNPDGTLAWAKYAIGVNREYGRDISVLSDDSTVVTGTIQSTATFGPGEMSETELVSAGSGDMFIARYNPDGTIAWAKSAGGTQTDRGFSVSVFSDSSFVVGGYFQNSATFGRGETNETVLYSADNVDIFLAHYNPDGTSAWAKYAGGKGYNLCHAVSVLSDDSFATTGSYQYSATFGPGEPYETVLAGSQSYNIFIARYSK
jgi:uncharacterized delta-60 repeat protein